MFRQIPKHFWCPGGHLIDLSILKYIKHVQLKKPDLLDPDLPRPPIYRAFLPSPIIIGPFWFPKLARKSHPMGEHVGSYIDISTIIIVLGSLKPQNFEI